MTSDQKKTLSEMKNSPFGKILNIYLEEKLAQINDIKTCLSWEETLGRKYALQLLRDIFYFLNDTKSTDKNLNQYE